VRINPVLQERVVSEYEISGLLADEHKSSLPSIAEIEAELEGVG
jgi:hypothetical protein